MVRGTGKGGVTSGTALPDLRTRPSEVADTVTVLSLALTELSTAVIVTVPVLVVAPTAIVSTGLLLNVKSPTTAFAPGAAATVIVVAKVRCAWSNVAVMVVVAPFSPIAEDDSDSVMTGESVTFTPLFRRAGTCVFRDVALSGFAHTRTTSPEPTPVFEIKGERSVMRLVLRYTHLSRGKFDRAEISEMLENLASIASKLVKVDRGEISERLGLLYIFSLFKLVKVDRGEISERFTFATRERRSKFVKVDRESRFVMLL